MLPSKIIHRISERCLQALLINRSRRILCTIRLIRVFPLIWRSFTIQIISSALFRCKQKGGVFRFLDCRGHFPRVLSSNFMRVFCMIHRVYTYGHFPHFLCRSWFSCSLWLTRLISGNFRGSGNYCQRWGLIIFSIVRFGSGGTFVRWVRFLIKIRRMIVFATAVMQFGRIRGIISIGVLFPSILFNGPLSMVVPSGLMRHIRTKHCQAIVTCPFSVNACHVKRHRFFQPLKNFVIPLPRNRCGNLSALFLLSIGCPILSVRQIRHCQIFIHMNRVGPILTIHAIISGLKRPPVTITHVCRRRIHALLMVLTRRIINRRELTQPAQPGCRLITINHSTFLRKRI